MKFLPYGEQKLVLFTWKHVVRLHRNVQFWNKFS